MQRKKTSEQRCHLQAHTRSACLSPSRPDNCSRVNAALCRCQHNKQAAACMGAHHLRYRISQKGGPGISSPASKACEGDLQQVDRACQGEAAVLGHVKPAFRGHARLGHSCCCTEQLWVAQRQLSGAACRPQAPPVAGDLRHSQRQHSCTAATASQMQGSSDALCAASWTARATSCSGSGPVQQHGCHMLTLGWRPACGRWTRGLHGQWLHGRLQADTKDVSFESVTGDSTEDVSFEKCHWGLRRSQAGGTGHTHTASDKHTASWQLGRHWRTPCPVCYRLLHCIQEAAGDLHCRLARHPLQRP